MENKTEYCVGTLRYHWGQLVTVSIFMLLATQSLALLCNHLVPTLSPVLLDEYGASSKMIALIVGTIPQVANFILNPLISTCSDKTRTRWGRRTPYLIISAPLMAGLLIAMSWTPEIAGSLQRFMPDADTGNLRLGVFAVLLTLFQIVYFFPGTVVYYLIADVIPQKCLVQYMSCSSLCATGMTFFFNYFILDLASAHRKTAFFIIGVFYLLAYIAQFFFVKEGKYPPVRDTVEKSTPLYRQAGAYFEMFFRQCFRHRIFVFLFVAVGLNQASTICRSMFNVLFAIKDIGMTMEEYGKVIGYGALVSAVIVLPMGKIMARFHPIMIYFVGGLVVMGTNAFGYFFVWSPGSFLVVGIAMTMVYTMQNLAWSPMGISLMPKDKYGQFCSAQGMVVALTLFIGSLLGGWLTDLAGYRIMFIWDFCMTGLAMAALTVVLKEWKRFGGKDHYEPPTTD